MMGRDIRGGRFPHVPSRVKNANWLMRATAPSACPSFRGVGNGFAAEWRHKLRGLAQFGRLLVRICEADDLLFLVWFAEERDGHRQALGAKAHWNDDGGKAD